MDVHPRTLRRALALAGLLVISPPRALAHSVPIGDTQWWQELDVAGSISDHWSYIVAGVSRFSSDDPNPALTGGGAFLTWMQGAFGYSLGYLHAQVRLPSSGAKIDADLPIAAVTGTFKAGSVTFSGRSRFEQLIGVPGNPWRYRNLLSVVTPTRLGPIKSFTASDEVFVDLTSGQLTRNRLLAGPMIELSSRVELSVNYLNERDMRSLPGRIQGTFVELMIRL
jgi:hypothetical protein